MLKWFIITVTVLGGALVASIDQIIKARTETKIERIRADELDGKLTALIERTKRAAEIRARGETTRYEIRSEANKIGWGGKPVPSSIKRVLCSNPKANCITLPPPAD